MRQMLNFTGDTHSYKYNNIFNKNMSVKNTMDY